MSSQNEHINFFEEIIRILNLKQRSQANFDDVLSSIDIKYSPSNYKSRKVIDELIIHQSKINKKRAIHRLIYSILISGVLLLSALLCLQYFNFSEKQKLKTPIHKEPVSDPLRDSLERKPVATDSSNNLEIDVERKMDRKAIPLKKDIIDTVTPDTIHKTIIKPDTLIEEVVIIDTIKVNYYESDVHSGNYCSFPHKYTILFDEKSVLIRDKYYEDILKLSNEILNCRNLNEIVMTGYYSQRFLFFNNKKKVRERIERIKREIRKCNVSSRTLKKSEISLIKIAKSNRQDSSQVVEIILKD